MKTAIKEPAKTKKNTAPQGKAQQAKLQQANDLLTKADLSGLSDLRGQRNKI